MRAAAAGANGLRFWGVYGVLYIRHRRNVRGETWFLRRCRAGLPGRSACIRRLTVSEGDLRSPVHVWLWLRAASYVRPPDGGPLRAYRLAVGRGRADGESALLSGRPALNGCRISAFAEKAIFRAALVQIVGLWYNNSAA